jgi:hypothetical protein
VVSNALPSDGATPPMAAELDRSPEKNLSLASPYRNWNGTVTYARPGFLRFIGILPDSLASRAPLVVALEIGMPQTRQPGISCILIPETFEFGLDQISVSAPTASVLQGASVFITGRYGAGPHKGRRQGYKYLRLSCDLVSIGDVQPT